MRLRGLLVSCCLVVACGARTSLPVPRSLEDEPPPPVCGNAWREEGEACDDGNEVTTDACLDCVLARCGDGEVFEGVEGCDDANVEDRDGCRADCSLTTCGDGVVDDGEDCDDGDQDDTDDCPTNCLFAKCGDGFLHAGFEECDEGAANADSPAFVLRQGEGLKRVVRPVERAASEAGFYAYQSASAHTGFEALQSSRLYLYRDTTTGRFSLFAHHGVDIDSSGQKQPESDVNMLFQHLPEGAGVVLADDKPEEFFVSEPNQVSGVWHFHQNTDGGVVGWLPVPGSWSIDIVPGFISGVAAWAYVDGDGAFVTLELQAVANLTTFPGPAFPCRLDCSTPRCGDGILDAGESCDDGNLTPGDGCSPQCT